MKGKEFLIKSYKHWSVNIHHNQGCLGRCSLWYMGDGDKNLFELSREDEFGFWKVGKKVKTALDGLFLPDKYYYFSAGLHTPHLHFHFIPRYKEKREFDGIVFEDPKPWRIPPAFKEVPQGTIFSIRDEIGKALDKL